MANSEPAVTHQLQRLQAERGKGREAAEEPDHQNSRASDWHVPARCDSEHGGETPIANDPETLTSRVAQGNEEAKRAVKNSRMRAARHPRMHCRWR